MPKLLVKRSESSMEKPPRRLNGKDLCNNKLPGIPALGIPIMEVRIDAWEIIFECKANDVARKLKIK
jgi:hypothetical protein